MIGVDAEAQQQLAPYLEPGEKLLWTGRPRRGLVLRPTDKYTIPFTILWCGFAIAALRKLGFFSIFGLLFVGGGLYLAIGRFFADAWIRARTVYGLTDRRAIIRSGLLTRRLSSTYLANLTDVVLSERFHGEGTIVLGRPLPSWVVNNSFVSEPPSFEFILDAARVYQLIQKTKADLTRPGQK